MSVKELETAKHLTNEWMDELMHVGVFLLPISRTSKK